MSDQLMITLQAALQQLASQQTVETLGDRSTYLGSLRYRQLSTQNHSQ